MAEDSYFFDSQDGTEAQFSRLLRHHADDGVWGVPGSTALQVFADSSGMVSKVRVGEATLRGWGYINDAVKSMAHDSNPSGNPRLDRVVLRADPVTANNVRLAVVKGTAASTPALPALTQTDGGLWQMHLGSVRVEGGAGEVGNPVQSIASNKVTEGRRFSGKRIIPCFVVADIPTGELEVPTYADEQSTGQLKRWNGSQWRRLVDVTTQELTSVSTPLEVTAGLPYVEVNQGPGSFAQITRLIGGLVAFNAHVNVVDSVNSGQRPYLSSGAPPAPYDVHPSYGRVIVPGVSHSVAGDLTLVYQEGLWFIGDEDGTVPAGGFAIAFGTRLTFNCIYKAA